MINKLRLMVLLTASSLLCLTATTSANESMMYPFGEGNVQLVTAEYFDRRHYRNYRGDEFWLSKNLEDPAIELELRGVIKLSKKAFMLKFRTRDMQVLPQKTYKVEHATLGPMALFFTSATNNRGTRMFYYAIINKEG